MCTFLYFFIQGVPMNSPPPPFSKYSCIHLQLTERGYLPSTPLEELCNYLNDAAIVGNIFRTPVVE
jgi:hypothetical protein